MPINDINKIQNDIINNIKLLMSERNITNQDIATKLKVNKSTVSMWLSGNNKMSLETILKIANLFEIPYINLLS